MSESSLVWSTHVAATTAAGQLAVASLRNDRGNGVVVTAGVVNLFSVH
jgi:hypothetical protein